MGYIFLLKTYDKSQVLIPIRVRKKVKCISKACPNHDNVILSFVLSRIFIPFSECIPKFACSLYCFYHFGHRVLKIGLLLHKSSP